MKISSEMPVGEYKSKIKFNEEKMSMNGQKELGKTITKKTGRNGIATSAHIFL